MFLYENHFPKLKNKIKNRNFFSNYYGRVGGGGGGVLLSPPISVGTLFFVLNRDAVLAKLAAVVAISTTAKNIFFMIIKI